MHDYRIRAGHQAMTMKGALALSVVATLWDGSQHTGSGKTKAGARKLLETHYISDSSIWQSVSKQEQLSFSSGQKRNTEELWQQFFADPSQWWDHRSDKKNARYPDFKHKTTQKALWVDGRSNPAWVPSELAAMQSDAVEHTAFIRNLEIGKCSKAGQYSKALQFFNQMQSEGVKPDKYTFVLVLKACSRLAALEEGKLIHQQVIESGCQSDVFVGNCLVNMYTECGSIRDACTVFINMPTRDLVTWNTMISGYVKCAESQKALETFQLMKIEEVRPDRITFVSVLSACANLAILEEGILAHSEVIRSSCESDISVGNCLIDMYIKCGSMESASRVFNNMSTRDVISWSAMIMGYAKDGQGETALKFFSDMENHSVQPNNITFMGALTACGSIESLAMGRLVHAQVLESKWESDVFVGNCLVDMYCKCGSIEDAYRVFKGMPNHSMVSWSTMLGGYSMHGYGKAAFRLFDNMCQEGWEIDNASYVCLLSACSHAGLVDEGQHYAESMTPCYNISPAIEHYCCMVDLLGRAGCLIEAKNVIEKMSCHPEVSVWMALLGACRMHGDLLIGERAAKQVLALDPENAAGYVMLSNIYAAAGKWNSTLNVHRLRLYRHVPKQPGQTWIEVNGQSHVFVANDDRHPQIAEIKAELKRLAVKIKKIGYAKNDIGKGQKFFSFCTHSEKLAIAFGLINTPQGTCLHLFKNLRVCDDCHTATKYISRIVRREIIVRDANRFHHFKEGVCSCKNYW
ncbi:hypothetical protein O6H91_04G027400 [Diphasiastrum complanatum]|uniref:Uncharacterized protein n=6 Tax=Diphasiastrum complanatum TaxID=34168 RepID=A0ACC2DV52_DIPCM|nr:hypothetical protein O6H91_04G027400 [Diphasiastrum complanatum]KAJ7558179.1 hypothetical protein O6H91_04G027400 [Diphasiastrum complanatum]KAJ7558183.1 hypothetical protein O6H91_04G027400 [Diphasiastrum complanatum]KAJ7558184.1 hypothetical protein O6H91_04G027400 [Diphasiastrum complanatum]